MERRNWTNWKVKSTRNPDSLCLLPGSPWTRTTAPSSRKEKFVESSTTWISPARSCSRWWGDRGCSRRRRSRRWRFRIFCSTRARGGGDYFYNTTLIDFAFYSSTNLPFSWMNICNIFLFSICFLFNLTEWPHYEARGAAERWPWRGRISTMFCY